MQTSVNNIEQLGCYFWLERETGLAMTVRKKSSSKFQILFLVKKFKDIRSLEDLGFLIGIAIRSPKGCEVFNIVGTPILKYGSRCIHVAAKSR